MEEHHISVPRSARYHTLGDPKGASDVWFVCHGYGQLAARFLERLRPLDDGSRCVVAPEGLSRFYLTEDPKERRVGASWMTREDRLSEIEDYVRYLDAVHQDVLGGSPPAPPGPRSARVTVLGFSQGAATACRWMAFGAPRADRLIVWGGEIPSDLDLAASPARERLRGVRLELVYGSRDEYFTAKIVAATEERLRTAGLAYTLVPYDGRHEIDEATLRRLA
jgi:predicted esterase